MPKPTPERAVRVHIDTPAQAAAVVDRIVDVAAVLRARLLEEPEQFCAGRSPLQLVADLGSYTADLTSYVLRDALAQQRIGG